MNSEQFTQYPYVIGIEVPFISEASALWYVNFHKPSRIDNN